MKYLWMVIVICLSSFCVHAQDDVQRLVNALLQETPVEEDLMELCDGIGGRETGSPPNMEAVEWGLKKFKETGVKAWKDPFEMPVLWLEKATTAQITGQSSFSPMIVSKYKTPPGKHTGEILYIGNYEDGLYLEPGYVLDCTDRFLLVETDLCFDIDGLFTEYIEAKKIEDFAYRNNAKGIIFMASRPNGLLYRFVTSKMTENEMPQFVMAREDAKRCVRLLKQGHSLNIEVTVDADVGAEFISHNVIAEIQGSDFPNEIIVIGAHLDSWALGTGANDNGCNVSMIIDIVRQIQKLKIKPRRTIRFALWNGEEQGYFGSWDYAKDHRKSLDQHMMAISIDIGSGPITGFFVNGRPELKPVLDKLLQPVAALGEFYHLDNPIVGTDNLDFMLEGVANLVAIHKPSAYGINYHASSDTYDKVDLESLNANSAIVAATILGLANLPPEKFTWKRQSRQEIQKVFDEHKLEFTMRMFNIWDPWVNGHRGRKE